jgi:hypothetical protein
VTGEPWSEAALSEWRSKSTLGHSRIWGSKTSHPATRSVRALAMARHVTEADLRLLFCIARKALLVPTRRLTYFASLSLAAFGWQFQTAL